MTKRLPLPVFAARESSPEEPARAASKPQRVLLLGPIQQENLALQYLAAAARRMGHDARVVAYSYRADLDAALRTGSPSRPIWSARHRVQNNIETISAACALREHGYRVT
jgi:hypothetical protein